MGPGGLGSFFQAINPFNTGASSGQPSSSGGMSSSAMNNYQMSSIPGQYNVITGNYNAPLPTQTNNPTNNQSSNQGSNQGQTDQQKWEAAGHPGTAPVGYHGESSGGASNNNQQDQVDKWSSYINNVYNPNAQRLQSFMTGTGPGSLAQMKNDALTNAQSLYDTQAGLIPGVEQNLKTSLGQGIQTAADAANRAYRALLQQASGFGSSSVGEALGGGPQGLAGEAYMNALGQRQNLAAQQGSNIDMFIQQKHADLDNWLNDAKKQIQDNFTNAFNQANQEYAGNESARSSAQLSILQNTIQQNRAIEQANMQFRNMLEIFRTTTPQTGTGVSNQQTGLNYGLANIMMQSANNPGYNLPMQQAPTDVFNTAVGNAFGGYNPRDLTTSGLTQ